MYANVKGFFRRQQLRAPQGRCQILDLAQPAMYANVKGFFRRQQLRAPQGRCQILDLAQPAIRSLPREARPRFKIARTDHTTGRARDPRGKRSRPLERYRRDRKIRVGPVTQIRGSSFEAGYTGNSETDARARLRAGSRGSCRRHPLAAAPRVHGARAGSPAFACVRPPRASCVSARGV